MDQICVECGDDLACEGHRYCSDCLEALGHLADEEVTTMRDDLDSNPWIREEDKAAIRTQREIAPTLDR